ncbi:MAG: hypothetical protein ACE5FO_05915 [Parvularculaceae bacterium]
MRAIVLEKPPVGVTERRLTRRVHAVWEQLKGEKLPDWRTIRRADMNDDWAWCFAVDWRLSQRYPYFIYLGDQLSSFSNVFLSGARECETTLLEKATQWMSEAARDCAPSFHDDDVTLYDGRRALLRSVILPLADDGETVTHILGAANGRFV